MFSNSLITHVCVCMVRVCVLQEFQLSDLDNLEKVLDNALIRFETTTL